MKPLGVLLLSVALCGAADLRLGLVGTDTSHATAFAKVLNDPTSKDYIPGAKIVAAYKGGSPDLPESATRVDKYAQELQSKYNIEIVSDIPTLCSKVDAVLLESVDGRRHLEQARQIIAAHKPMFIDKPLASTLADAREIARLAKEAGVPWFSTSSLRYSEIVKSAAAVSDKLAVTVWGPSPFEEHHQMDLSWYGIHPAEMLFTIMGPGCEEVTRTVETTDPGTDLITCRWKDGRIGSMYGMRPYGPYGAIVVRPKAVAQFPDDHGVYYVPMLREIIQFFHTGKVPVPNDVTLEIMSFMDAAQRSKDAGGLPMKLR